MNNYVIWVYQLGFKTLNKNDKKMAIQHNLLIQDDFMTDSTYIIGDFNTILNYITLYLGIELVTEYLKPFKMV